MVENVFIVCHEYAGRNVANVRLRLALQRNVANMGEELLSVAQQFVRRLGCWCWLKACRVSASIAASCVQACASVDEFVMVMRVFFRAYGCYCSIKLSPTMKQHHC